MLLHSSRIALAQTTSVLGDVATNVARHAEIIEKAIDQKANAVIFPELSLTGYTVRDLNFESAVHPKSKVLKPLLDLSKKITIVCGAIEEDDRGAVYNAAFTLENGSVIHVHRKIYPPAYGIFEERRYFSSGTTLRAFHSERLGRIGLLVCEDLWHPILPYLLAQQDAQMIVTIAASPTRLDTGEDATSAQEPHNYTVNREHHSSYARLLGVYMAFVNKVGVEDGVNFWGGSELVAPSGEVVERCAFFDPDLRFAEIVPCYVRESRQLSRHFLDEDMFLTGRLWKDTIEYRRQSNSETV